MDTLRQDFRYALRQLRRRPVFGIAAVSTVALGVGSTTAIFSAVDTLLLRPLPYPEPDRIVTVWQDDRREGNPRADVAPANFVDWRERARSFQVLAAAEPFSFALERAEGPPLDLPTNLVTEGFFRVLGVRPRLGRLFLPEDHLAGNDRVVVLGHALWRDLFGAEPEVVGRTLTLDGRPFEVVGVLPPEVELGLPQVDEAGLWSPQVIQEDDRRTRGDGWWNVVGRLRPGVSLAEAGADMDRVAAALSDEFPATNAQVGATVIPLHEHMVSEARPVLLLLFGATLLVMLIACANLANLQLAHATERGREFAVRAAIGAGRGRLLTHLLTQSAVVAALGGTVGMLLAFWGVDLLRGLAPGDIPRMEAVAVDPRVLAFALGLTAASALAFGALPALRFSRPELQAALRRGTPGGGGPGFRPQRVLIALETALALAVLVGAGLLLRSFAVLSRVDPGFSPDGVLALQVFAWDGRPTEEARVQFFDGTLESIRRLPGVLSAGALSAAPFMDADMSIRVPFHREGRSPARPGEEPEVYVSHATPEVFRTLSVPLLRGRTFDDRDRSGAAPVALIDETLWRRHWEGEDPIGARIRLGLRPHGTGEGRTVEVVGVVGPIRHTALDVEPRPELFLPQPQTGFASMTYLVRTAGDPASVADAVQRAVWDEDPRQTFYQVGRLEDLVAHTLAGRRFSLVLLAVFAGMALLLAAVGIYGVIAFAVGSRTRELGIRMALGADRKAVLGLVLWNGMAPAAAGAALGVLGALVASGLLSGLLFGVPPRDAVTLAGAAATLLGVALLACWVPARRAARLNPMAALREE